MGKLQSRYQQHEVGEALIRARLGRRVLARQSAFLGRCSVPCKQMYLRDKANMPSSLRATNNHKPFHLAQEVAEATATIGISAPLLGMETVKPLLTLAVQKTPAHYQADACCVHWWVPLVFSQSQPMRQSVNGLSRHPWPEIPTVVREASVTLREFISKHALTTSCAVYAHFRHASKCRKIACTFHHIRSA